jgi:putative sterol carrier protein
MIKTPRLFVRLLAAATFAFAGVAAGAEPVLLSLEWAGQLCQAWNQDPVLTKKLVESKWVCNDKGCGFKIAQIYRTDCEDSPYVELRLHQKDGAAECLYGGRAQSTKPDLDVDYVMHAETRRWVEMGKGEYGPMKGMMSARLKFDGPMFEAMNNMGPFQRFLLLAGKVPGDTGQCPAVPKS